MDAFVAATFAFPEPPPIIPPEMRGRLLWVCHDFQTEYYNYETRQIFAGANGTPATCKCADTISERMDERYQILWFDALQHYAHGRTREQGLKVWGGLTHSAKAFCNKTGTDILADYVRGVNLDKEPARQEHIVCTGNVLISARIEKNIGGELVIGVLCLDRWNLPTLETLLAHPAVNSFLTVATVTTIQHSTQPNRPSTTIAPNGTRVEDPFPDNQNYPSQITPVPFAAWTGDKVDFMGIPCRIKFIRANRLAKLPDNEFPISPFVRR